MPNQPTRSDRLNNQLWGTGTTPRRCTTKPRVSITIDHLSIGTVLSTRQLIKQTYHHAPSVHFTVFVMCADKKSCCSNSMQEAKKIYNLNKKLIRLGVHTLPMSGRNKANEVEQFYNIALLHDGLSKIIGSKYLSLSYHGPNAGGSNEKVIPCFLEKYIRYGRTIQADTGANYDSLFTPVVSDGSSVTSAKKIIDRNWKSCRTTTFFFHSHQLVGPSRQRQLFNAVIHGIKKGEYESFPFPK